MSNTSGTAAKGKHREPPPTPVKAQSRAQMGKSLQALGDLMGKQKVVKAATAAKRKGA